MGDLMYQSHYSYTECGLGNEATDLLVDLVREQGRRACTAQRSLAAVRAAQWLSLAVADAREAFDRRGRALCRSPTHGNHMYSKVARWAPTGSA